MAKHKYLDENGLLYLVQKIKTWLNAKVDKVNGKGLSTNDYTTEEKTKLAGIATGANKTTVDTALNSTSTNPVQNKVINTALGNKVDKVTGKGLSTNDYTTEEKNKLEGLKKLLAGTGINISDNGYISIKEIAGFQYDPTTDNNELYLDSSLQISSKGQLGVNVNTILSNTPTKTEMNTAITNAVNQAVSSAVIYKGTVASFDKLPTGASVGHLYNVQTDGMNYVWNGTEWDAQGGTVDLSNYVEESDLVAITNAEIDAIFA